MAFVGAALAETVVSVSAQIAGLRAMRFVGKLRAKNKTKTGDTIPTPPQPDPEWIRPPRGPPR